jgi:hypothetical protein
MGWIALTYSNDIPVCLWITARECCLVEVCLDERLFGDTIIRAEKVGKKYNMNGQKSCFQDSIKRD